MHNAHSSNSDGEPGWPSHSNFSPYDLFGLDRNAPYSKRRFYELAKVYHPDRACSGHPACKGLSDPTRTERYRIIVAAHELLSDPAKREAYDKFGDGWHHQTNKRAGRWQHTQYGHGRGGPDPIFRNATWEDWEEWRAAQAGRTATATAVPHNTFATFVVLIMLFIGSAHAITIGKYATSVEDRVKAVHEKCSRFLDERRNQTTTAQTDSGDANIQNFLIKRDPSGSGLREGEEESYRHILDPRRTTTVGDDIAKLEDKSPNELDERTER